MSGRILIRNGRVATPAGFRDGDVLVEGPSIAAVGAGLDAPSARVLDATGCMVLPGGVDVHTHLNLKLGRRQVADGFQAGTTAAAFGGTTTVVDHPEAGPEGCSLLHQPDFYREQMQRQAVVDFGIHGVFQDATESTLASVPRLVAAGHASGKIYLTYDARLDLQQAGRILAAMKAAGALTAFHAEDHETIERLREQYATQGLLSPRYHALSRPAAAEAESIAAIVELVARTGAPAYIVHLSSAAGLDVVRQARRSGLPVLAETCPQYLLLDASLYEETDGLKYIMAPPLRAPEDAEALWEGLADGSIDVVATDHCAFSLADKRRFGAADFRQVPGGCPGVETRLPLLYSEGVLTGRLTPERFVDLVAANPARIMGLFPRKGVLQPGADADVLIWDSAQERILSRETLHEACDFSPFDGRRVTGWPRMTLLRGEVIVDHAEFLGQPGSGRFVSRSGAPHPDSLSFLSGGSR